MTENAKKYGLKVYYLTGKVKTLHFDNLVECIKASAFYKSNFAVSRVERFEI